MGRNDYFVLRRDGRSLVKTGKCNPGTARTDGPSSDSRESQTRGQDGGEGGGRESERTKGFDLMPELELERKGGRARMKTGRGGEQRRELK